MKGAPLQYRAWLLFQRPPNDELEFLLTDLGLYARLDLTERPPASIRMRGDEAILSSEDPDYFFEHVFEHKSVPAFCTAPVEELRQMDSKVFFHRARYVRLHCNPDRVPTDREPYYRRWVRFEYMTSALQGDFDTSLTRVEKSKDADGHVLFLNPVPIDITEDRVHRLFGDHARALGGINGLFLPPTRRDLEGTYFEDDLVRMRDLIARRLKLESSILGEPTALVLWRLEHDPFLRDFLLEGGLLDFSCAESQPTFLLLEVSRETGGDPVAAYRALFALEPAQVPGPSWASKVATALAGDLRSLEDSGVDVRARRRPAEAGMMLPAERGYQASALPEGSWQRFYEYEKGIHGKDDRIKFHERVLWPSRARGSTPPDHDLAERLFIANYWRSPWSPSRDRGAWRYAMLDLLRWELVGLKATPSARVESWGVMEEGWPWIEKGSSDTMPLVVHRPDMDRDELRQWRLLLPVGSVLKEGGTIRLNDVLSRLNRGFVLA